MSNVLFPPQKRKSAHTHTPICAAIGSNQDHQFRKDKTAVLGREVCLWRPGISPRDKQPDRCGLRSHFGFVMSGSGGWGMEALRGFSVSRRFKLRFSLMLHFTFSARHLKKW